MFDLAIDSKLRGCDIAKLKIGDLVSGGRVHSRAIVIQRKTGRPVQFELLEPARISILAWLEARGGALDDHAFPSRLHGITHVSTRSYARLVDEWVTGIGLRGEDHGTHSLRRTKASMIDKRTGNLRAVQMLLGHTKIENTVRYLGVESRMLESWPKEVRLERSAPRLQCRGASKSARRQSAHIGHAASFRCFSDAATAVV